MFARCSNRAKGMREKDLLGCIRYRATLFFSPQNCFCGLFPFLSPAVHFLPSFPSQLTPDTNLLNTEFCFPKRGVQGAESAMCMTSCDSRGETVTQRLTTPPHPTPPSKSDCKYPSSQSLLIHREMGKGRDVESEQL